MTRFSLYHIHQHSKCKRKTSKWNGNLGSCVKMCENLTMSNDIGQKCKSKKNNPKKKTCSYKCPQKSGVFDLGGESLVSSIKTKLRLFSL